MTKFLKTGHFSVFSDYVVSEYRMLRYQWAGKVFCSVIK